MFLFAKMGNTALGQTTMRIILVDCVAFMNIFRMPAPLGLSQATQKVLADKLTVCTRILQYTYMYIYIHTI